MGEALIQVKIIYAGELEKWEGEGRGFRFAISRLQKKLPESENYAFTQSRDVGIRGLDSLEEIAAIKHTLRLAPATIRQTFANSPELQ